MQTKIKLSAILLMLLLFALFPISSATTNAQTFNIRKPAFGLYCENQSADIHGTVKYVIDENGQAVQHSEYTINADSEKVTLYIPFIANAFTIPQIEIDAECEICYGKPYSLFTDELNYEFYTTNIGNITGTIYTLTSSSESFTIDFTMLENQNYIYRLTNNRTEIRSDKHHTYIVNNAEPDIPYEIFIINGDCFEFISSAEITKETITVKEYIARNLLEFEDYFSPLGTATPDVLYAVTKQALAKNINYDFFVYFLNSYTQQRLIAYKIVVHPSCTIEYSMPVDVQNNSTFNPAIYRTEQTAMGNYNIDYIIELNSNLPFVIESSAEVKRQGDNIYIAENVNSDFYFVFSASEKPINPNGDNNKMETWRIVLLVLSGVFGCALIVSLSMLIYYSVKYTKARKEN